jgi:hypothetical protein
MVQRKSRRFRLLCQQMLAMRQAKAQKWQLQSSPSSFSL